MSARRMRSGLVPGLIICSIIAGSGCQQAEPEYVGEQRANQTEEEAFHRMATAGLEPGASQYAHELTPGDEQQAQPAASRRILVYNAALQLAVARVEPSVTTVKALAEELGGYMERMDGNSITIRIPAAEFFPTVARLEQMGTVIRKNINTLDVTDEYVDLELRLKNAQATLRRLEEILADADSVPDVLAVEKEVARVREEMKEGAG